MRSHDYDNWSHDHLMRSHDSLREGGDSTPGEVTLEREEGEVRRGGERGVGVRGVCGRG